MVLLFVLPFSFERSAQRAFCLGLCACSPFAFPWPLPSPSGRSRHSRPHPPPSKKTQHVCRGRKQHLLLLLRDWSGQAGLHRAGSRRRRTAAHSASQPQPAGAVAVTASSLFALPLSRCLCRLLPFRRPMPLLARSWPPWSVREEREGEQ